LLNLVAKNFFWGFKYSMGFKNHLEKTLEKFGKNNKPAVIAMGIAIAKGIVRPTFTMMDKKESYETKRYTAIREGLTELIAIPVYFLSGFAGEKLAKKLAVPQNFMSKTMYKKYKAGNTSAKVMKSYNHAKELAEVNLPKITSSLTFIGVCVSALLVIPGLCSVTIKPIMKGIEKRRAQKKKPEAVEKLQNPVEKPQKPIDNNNKLQTFKGLYHTDLGTRIGGPICL